MTAAAIPAARPMPSSGSLASPATAPLTRIAPASVRPPASQTLLCGDRRVSRAVAARISTGAVYWSAIATPTGTRAIAR